MSVPKKYRAPAWQGLNVTAPIYESVEPHLALEVLNALGSGGQLLRMANIGDASSFFLRFDSDSGESSFLKIVSDDRARALSQAEALAQWLQNAGLRVVASKRYQRLVNGLQMWVYAFHAGRPPEAQVPDTAMIGSALGRLHYALEKHPMRAQWKRTTDERILRLMDTRELVASGRVRAGPDADLFRRIASDRSILLHPDMFSELGPRTPIHGDLNRFNMLIDAAGCTFLDFEDVQHSVFPAIVDLATVIERVVFVSQGAHAYTESVGSLIDAYQAETKTLHLDANMQSIFAIQRSIALRSLCTLAQTDSFAHQIEEWTKFFKLHSQAEDAIALHDGKKKRTINS
jgi:Ser/Thr protein kinase RdoA (MazF antagonist)